MQKKTFRFGGASVDYYFDGSFAQLKEITDPANTVLVTDEHLFEHHAKKFRNWKTIVLKAGEQHKVQSTVDSVIAQLIGMEADRKTTLVGIGGGVITDLTGYIASIYKRGVPFGFIPTTLLALVDASIGGKNGIDVGEYKNMVGVIRQPQFLLHDLGLLKTLPDREWRNGFAEIIKHACIRDAALFRQLEENNLSRYQKKKELLSALIRRNALIKTKVVQADEFEQGERRLLNFGHTLAHAIETPYGLMHGEAVAIGMAFAAGLSQQLTGFRHKARIIALLEQYGLPHSLQYDKEKVFALLKGDKKKEADFIHFILLQKLGKGIIQKINLEQVYESL